MPIKCRPMFEPNLRVLHAAQRELWKELSGVPSQFVLYGGTALALQLGHRQSVDFDFFCSQTFNPGQLFDRLAFLADSQVIQQAANTLTCRVIRDEPVLVSFFGLPSMRQIGAPLIAADNNVAVASLLNLAGTKASVVQQRAEAKDYIDLDALFAAGVSLPQALAAAHAIYGDKFNAQLTLKALSFFGDGDLPSLAEGVQQRIRVAVRSIDLDHLPATSQSLSPIGP